MSSGRRSSVLSAEQHDFLERRLQNRPHEAHPIVKKGNVSSKLSQAARSLERSIISDNLNQQLYSRPNHEDVAALMKHSDVAPSLRAKKMALERSMTQDQLGNLLNSRADHEELLSAGILKHDPGQHSSKIQMARRQLEHSMTTDKVGHLLEQRSELDDLTRTGTIKDTTLAPSLHGPSMILQKNLAKSNLYHALKYRPSVVELIEKGIIPHGAFDYGEEDDQFATYTDDQFATYADGVGDEFNEYADEYGDYGDAYDGQPQYYVDEYGNYTDQYGQPVHADEYGQPVYEDGEPVYEYDQALYEEGEYDPEYEEYLASQQAQADYEDALAADAYEQEVYEASLAQQQAMYEQEAAGYPEYAQQYEEEYYEPEYEYEEPVYDTSHQRRSKNFHLTRILLKFVASMAEAGEISLEQKGFLKDLIVDQDQTILAVAETFDAENDLHDFKDSLQRLASR